MPIPAGYELTEEGKKYANYMQNYTVDPKNPNGVMGANNTFLPVSDKPLIQPVSSATSTATLGNEQKANLKTTLDTEKEKELTRLDDILASRGVSRSGAVGAGTAEIAKNYANALSSGNVGIDTSMKQLDLQQSNQDMMKQYYDALTKSINDKSSTGGSTVQYGGVIPPASYDSTQKDTSGQGYVYDSNTGTMAFSNAPNLNTTKAPKAKLTASNYQIY